MMETPHPREEMALYLEMVKDTEAALRQHWGDDVFERAVGYSSNLLKLELLKLKSGNPEADFLDACNALLDQIEAADFGMEVQRESSKVVILIATMRLQPGAFRPEGGEQ